MTTLEMMYRRGVPLDLLLAELRVQEAHGATEVDCDFRVRYRDLKPGNVVYDQRRDEEER